MQNFFPIVSVNAIIFTNPNNYILTRRSDNHLWCLPGGIVEFGETIAEAIVREIREEICVTCSVDRLVGIYSSNNTSSKITLQPSIILAFKCHINNGVPLLSDEVNEIGLFDINNQPADIIESHKIRIEHAFKNQIAPFIF